MEKYNQKKQTEKASEIRKKLGDIESSDQDESESIDE